MSLYFRQLAAGRDFGADNPVCGQMQNLVYLIGCTETRECVVVDPAWAVDAIVDAAEDSDKDDSKLFEAVAAANEANRYVFGRGDVLRSAFGIELGHILLLKSFDGGEARLAPPFSKTALEQFVSLEGRPLLFDFGPSTAQAIFGAGIHRHLLYLGRGSDLQNQQHCQTVSFPYM